MDRFLFSIVPLAFIVLGVCMVIWPTKVILQNRDKGEETRPPTVSEIWRTRLLGMFLIAGGGYGLYALLSGLPGAEFAPA
jgi:hypothetical protein